MTILVSIDPGIRACGVAGFEDRVLKWAEYVQSNYTGADNIKAAVKMSDCVRMKYCFYFVDHVISEVPVMRKGSPVPPADIMHLYGVVAAIGSTQLDFETVQPSTWKGTVPKKIFLERILKCLTDEERQRLPKLPASKLHNVIDAVGIGLWKLGRLNAKGK